MNIHWNPRKLTQALIIIASLIVIVHSIVLGIYFYIDDPDEFDFVRLIDLDYEGNIPTLFSALLFIINGCLLLLVSKLVKQKGQKYSNYWFGLAIIFVFLGFDGGSRLHEEIGDLFEHIVDAQGWLYFPWVIPYVTLLLIALAVYFKFYLTLDRWLQIRLFLCAAIFVGGAVGVELFSAREADENGTSSLLYSVLYTIEESMEMAGLILLINTLLIRLRQDTREITVKLVKG